MSPVSVPSHHRRFLSVAARLALRGHGGAEPNPMVGCVIVNPAGQIVGWGYHRRCGAEHAEIIALRRAGANAARAALYCTMEPCNHTGRTGPCTDAIIQAGIAKVIIARRDPNPIAAGGLDKLKSAGVAVEVFDQCDPAIEVSDPFAQRVRSGLPWVTVKWAQTIDGRIATRPPHNCSQWISNAASRQLVHRERGRVDAILTGIGTVRADDPMLTARSVRVRRIARRVVIDPGLQTPLSAKLVMTAKETPTVLVCDESKIGCDAASRLRALGVELMGFTTVGGEIPLAAALRELVSRFDATRVLVEAGSGLMSRLFRQKLVNEAWVFIGPLLLGDEAAQAAVKGMTVTELTAGTQLQLRSLRRRGDDVVLRYRVQR